MYSPAVDDDISVIVALMNPACRRAETSPGWSTEEAYLQGDRTTEALLRADIEAIPAAYLLKWRDERAQGVVGSVWLQPVEGRTWYLGSLATDFQAAAP